MAVTTIDFETWQADVDGELIDRDRGFGAQCWDLVADFGNRCAGAPIGLMYTSGRAPDGTLVLTLVRDFPAQRGVERYFTKHTGAKGIRAGDILVWGRTRAHPQSHTAVALAAAKGGEVRVMSQNDRGSATEASGATHRTTLSTDGIIGYLRPRTLRRLPAGRLIKRTAPHRVQVRASASSHAHQIAVLKPSRLKTVSGWQRDSRGDLWLRVRVKGRYGWIHQTGFVRITASTTKRLRQYR